MMECPKVRDEEPHAAHWHTVFLDGRAQHAAAGGSCPGFPLPLVDLLDPARSQTSVLDVDARFTG